jgi:Polyketide cyclase / dehydrase and lipid transport
MTHKQPQPMVASDKKEAAMSTKKPAIRFHVELKTDVSPDAVYALLSDPNSHLVWAGEQAPNPAFKLLAIEGATVPATVGTTWKSTGANSKDGSSTFHDVDTVVRADPGKAFGFDAEAKLDRKNGKTWYCHFEHRYTIEPRAGGSTIIYNCDVFPKNYTPYWLFPMMKPMTRLLVNGTHRKHMKNLARMAAETTARA